MPYATSAASSLVRRHAPALFSYICVALALSWPLPLHVTDALPGPVSGDTGVYVWNLWLFTVLAMAAMACVLLLSPVLAALVGAMGESQWSRPTVFWRSSPPGLDLFAFFVPNPLHPWFGRFFAEGARLMPGGVVENIASVPWTLTAALVAAAACAPRSLPGYWLAFTAFAATLALGPFIHIGGVMTYVPTPWALLRYVPVIGAARMPQRMSVLVMLGGALLLAFALRGLRERLRGISRGRTRPAMFTAVVAGTLLFEMLPAPRTQYSAAVPSVNRIIAADPRPVRVLNLPFGLRDGLSSHDAAGQYFQTVHEKQLLGGYVSRLPLQKLERHRKFKVTRVLMDLSEGLPVSRRRRCSEMPAPFCSLPRRLRSRRSTRARWPASSPRCSAGHLAVTCSCGPQVSRASRRGTTSRASCWSGL